MPELSIQLCSSCELGAALLQMARVLPATWEQPQPKPGFCLAGPGFAELLLFTGAGAHARLRGGGCCEAQGAARQEFTGGEGEVGSAARAKPEPPDPSTAHTAFLKAKREVV